LENGQVYLNSRIKEQERLNAEQLKLLEENKKDLLEKQNLISTRDKEII